MIRPCSFLSYSGSGSTSVSELFSVSRFWSPSTFAPVLMACCFCPSLTASFAMLSTSSSVVFSFTSGITFSLPSNTLSGSLFNAASISLSVDTACSVETGVVPLPSTGGFLGSCLVFGLDFLLSCNSFAIASLVNEYCACNTANRAGFFSA